MIRFLNSFVMALLISSLIGAPVALAGNPCVPQDPTCNPNNPNPPPNPPTPNNPNNIPLPQGNGFGNTTGPQGPCMESDPGLGFHENAGGPSAATDPCHKLKLFRTAQTVQLISTIVYLAGATACFIGCLPQKAGGMNFWIHTCKASVVGAQVVDMAGAAAVGNEGKHIYGQIVQSMSPLINSHVDPGSSIKAQEKDINAAKTKLDSANSDLEDAKSGFADGDERIKNLQKLNDETNAQQQVAENDRNTANGLRKALTTPAATACCIEAKVIAGNATCKPSATFSTNSSCQTQYQEWINAEGVAMESGKKYEDLKKEHMTLSRSAKKQIAAQKKYDEEKNETNWDKPSCVASALNLLQATARYANYKTSKQLADDALNEKRNMTGGSDTNTSSTTSALQAGSGDKGNHGNTAEGQGNDPVREAGLAAQAFLEGKGQSENAALAAQVPLLKNFENQTGIPIKDVAEKLASGIPPADIISQAAGAVAGPESSGTFGQLNASVAPLADQLSAQLDQMDKESGLSQSSSFAGGGGSAAPSKSGDGMPDLGAMMAAFMPKKPGADGARGPAAAAAAAAAAKPSEEGLHPPARSIFDVVDARYQVLAQRFLDGGTVTSPNQKPASLLPSNPYLRKQ